MVDIKIIKPQRVMDQASGRIKLDIVRYYEAVAEWALPHLQARLLALVRAPDGMLPQRFSSVLGPKIESVRSS